MDISEAAYIIGSLGGRPLKYHRKGFYGGGFPANGYQTEDLSAFYTDEFGIDIYITET